MELSTTIHRDMDITLSMGKALPMAMFRNGANPRFAHLLLDRLDGGRLRCVDAAGEELQRLGGKPWGRAGHHGEAGKSMKQMAIIGDPG